MSEILDKKQVKKDLEKWASRLRKIDEDVRQLYLELNEVYALLVNEDNKKL